MLTEEGKMGPKRKKIQDKNLETRSIMFVEHTREGEMAKNLREQLGRMENMRGFRMKIVERTGTKIKDMFSLTNIWGGVNVVVRSVQLVPKGGRTCLTVHAGVLYMRAFV